MDTPKNKVCGLPCEIWSRVCGYHRPIQFFNVGKQEEFKDRLTFKPFLNHPKDKTV